MAESPLPESPLPIVLIDDAVDVRRVVAMQLQMSRRFTIVAEGGTGREAITLAAAHRPAVLLLDVSMPDMDGLEALPAILGASPDTRVVMFSGFSGQGLPERAQSLGAVGFIEKSLPIRELPVRLLEASGLEAAPPPGPPAALAEPAAPAPARAPAQPPDPPGPPGSDEGLLLEHLERFRDIFERATVGMATLTLTGTIVRSNDAFAAIVGSKGDLVGRPFRDLVDHEALADLRDATAGVVERGESSRALEHQLAGGGPWVRSTLATVRDTAGAPLYLFLEVEDISARRAVQEELRRSEERFGLLVSSVVDYAIFMLDPGGHVMTWNAGAERIKGWSEAEIVGQHFRIFYTEEAKASRHPEHELEIAAEKGRYEEEGWRVRKDGSQFWAVVVITALFNRAGDLVGFAKVTRDSTQRQQTMEALADAKEMFAAAAAEKSRFLAIAAHELRSPSGSVSAAATMLRDRANELDDRSRRELLDALVSGTRRIRLLVDDMLLASQLEERGLRYSTEPIELGPAVDAAIAAVPGMPAVELDVAPGAVADADPQRLSQILTNLLSNAKAYGAPPIQVIVELDGTDAHIRVADAGDGVPEEVIGRLFTPFTRGPGRPDRGTGLGLFIVRELARGMGGDAWFEREGRRTVFAVRLPRPVPHQA